jgi:hypothetical protein
MSPKKNIKHGQQLEKEIEKKTIELQRSNGILKKLLI